jgi:hypothetical protein
MTQVLGKMNEKIRVRLDDGRECEGCPGSLLETRETGIFTEEGEFIALPVISDLETHKLGVLAVSGEFLALI